MNEVKQIYKSKQFKGTVNVLAFGGHPDDVEACAGGFLLKAKQQGLTTGIIDLSRGEASNFGSMEERDGEAERAAKILGLDVRLNLNIPDEHVLVNEEHIQKVVRQIRILQPDIIIAPYFEDLHPDHANTGKIVEKAAFFAKIQKYSEAIKEKAHQPGLLLFFMLHTEFDVSFVLDVSEHYTTKLRAVHAHTSQFFKKNANGGYSKQFHNDDFMDFFNSRARYYGYKTGTKYGEPFLMKGYLGLQNFGDIISGELRSLTSWKKKI